MNARARNFIAANEISPVVYGSVDEGRVTYRLANGKMFRLNVFEARQVPNPRWAWVEREANAETLAAVDREERDLYRRLKAEAEQ